MDCGYFTSNFSKIVVVLYSFRNVSLGQYLGKEENLLLVLLRHFGWQPWRDHLTELKNSKVRQPVVKGDENCTAASKVRADLSHFWLWTVAWKISFESLLTQLWTWQGKMLCCFFVANVPESASLCSLNHRHCFCFCLFLIQKLLEAQSLRVLVVSYGSLEGATFWLDHTGYEFDMLLDAERVVRTIDWAKT